MRCRLKERARDLRKTSTACERKIWYWLRHRYVDGYKFRRQHPTDDDYILDFYCAELKLCIELDGPVHDTAEQAEYDAARTRTLMAKNIRVVRIRNEYVREQPDGAWAM